jgi:serine/threonine protein kinase
MTQYAVHNLIGKILKGRYQILPEFTDGSGEPFKQGAHAIVYRAIILNAKAGEPSYVCVKVFCPDSPHPLTPTQENNLKSFFIREADFYARAKHPGVIELFDAGAEFHVDTGETIIFQVLEHMGGGTIDAHCRQLKASGLRLSISEVLDYLRQIVPAISYVHLQGIVHRDLKPKNLLLSADRLGAKVADFGVAGFVDDRGDVARVGADIWAPPEHHPKLSSEGVAFPPALTSDVYTLAKTTYFLLSGITPWEFACAPITKLPQSISGEPWAGRVLDVLNRATRRNPAARPQSVTAFFEDLHAAFYGASETTHIPPMGGTVRTLNVSVPKHLSRRERILLCATVAGCALFMAAFIITRLAGWGSASSAPSVEKHDDSSVPCRPATGLVNLPVKTKTEVNLRTRPSKHTQSLCVIKNGASVVLLGNSQRGWYQVRVVEPNSTEEDACYKGMEGWSYGEFYEIKCAR